jgi:hypothetical protein
MDELVRLLTSPDFMVGIWGGLLLAVAIDRIAIPLSARVSLWLDKVLGGWRGG